jgi:hypothetical protein
MAFLEIKGMLAKLLATENLNVEHSPSAKTASFNVATRTMVLPIWETESEEVYNLFVSHEVGHALWTPTDFPEQLQKAGVNRHLANIIEDARIEKMIQQKFPGLRRDYALGYKTIFESGWFETDEDGIAELGLIDRVNLHYKVGAGLLVPFSEEERKFLDEIDACEDYEDIITVSEEIQKYVSSQKDKSNNPLSGFMNLGEDEDFVSITYFDPEEDEDEDEKTEEAEDQKDPDDDENEEAEDQKDPDDDENEEAEDQKDPDDDENEEAEEEGQKEDGVKRDAVPLVEEPPAGDLESLTQEALERAMSNMVDSTSRDITYLTVPTYKSKEFIHPITCVRDGMDPDIVAYLKSRYNVDDLYSKFMLGARRDVNHMVQQFDMRKSAEIYARVQVNKTGMLNTGQLHNYKLTDDIFLRQEVAPKGKSHGMVMLLDWSQSMDKISLDTIKQVLVLAQFCRKIQIPFKVFTFTTGAPYNVIPGELHKNEPRPAASMVEVLNSTVKSHQLDKDMYNLFLVGFGKSVSNYYTKNTEPCKLLQQGGTPLINAMFMSAKVLEEFKEETKVDKISFVVVTDGESARLVYWNEKGKADSHYGSKLMIRGKNSSVFRLDEDYRRTPGSLGKWITETQPSVSVTNIFLGNYKVCNAYQRSIIGWGYLDEQREFCKTEFNKNNGLHFTTHDNWPLVALMNPASFKDTDDEIKVADDAKVGQIRTAFKKFLNKKSGSKRVLTAIVESFA